MRSLATRESRTELAKSLQEIIDVVRAASYDFIIVETSGIGQGDAAITDITDLSMYVMTAEFGAPSQLEKIDMIDFADFIVINKYEQKGSEDALNQVRKQYERSHLLFGQDKEKFPVFGTIASQFNDAGTNALFATMIDTLCERYGWDEQVDFDRNTIAEKQNMIITNERRHYLREIATHVRQYHKHTNEQRDIARKLYRLEGAKQELDDETGAKSIDSAIQNYEERMDPSAKSSWTLGITSWSSIAVTSWCTLSVTSNLKWN